MAKNNGKNGEKFSPLWQKWRENVRHFRHNGENGEKIDGKMAKMARMAKINGENGEFFFSPFLPFRHGENREKNKWRMAMSPQLYLPLIPSSSEFLFIAVCPGIGGVSGIFLRYSPRTTLKASKDIIVLTDFGSVFHNREAFILNEFS